MDPGKNWNEARQGCRNLGGDLATATSYKDVLLLRSYVIKFKDSNSFNNMYWLGGESTTNKKGWRWLTGESLPLDHMWASGEPDGETGCLTIFKLSSDNSNIGLCQDPCTRRDGKGYFCELPR